jgi:hypothetical protein
VIQSEDDEPDEDPESSKPRGRNSRKVVIHVEDVAEFLATDGESKTDEPIEIGVLEENEIVVDVYLRCRAHVAVGMGVAHNDITGTEIRSVVDLLDVPRQLWPYVTDGVQTMSTVVTAYRNTQAAKKAKS